MDQEAAKVACPECQGENVVAVGEPYLFAGKQRLQVHCPDCDYRWGALEAECRAPAAPVEAPAAKEAPAEISAGKIRPLLEGVRVEPVEPKDLKPEEAIAFERDGEHLVCEVAKVTRARVYLDVEDAPDTWVPHAKVLGRVVAGD